MFVTIAIYPNADTGTSVRHGCDGFTESKLFACDTEDDESDTEYRACRRCHDNSRRNGASNPANLTGGAE